jgi:hypothetical protein
MLITEKGTLPTDEELRCGLTRTEDTLIERKTAADSRDWLRTIVAFANSVPQDRVGILYIGVRDDGTIEAPVNLDSLQKTLRQKAAAAYPPIDYSTRVLSDDGGQYLCVLIPGSRSRPHFAGPAYVRVGAETVEASDSQYEGLIAQRNSKAYRILRHKGQTISVHHVRTGREATLLGRVATMSLFQITDCTTLCVMLRDQYGQNHSIALERIQVLEEPGSPGLITLEILNN